MTVAAHVLPDDWQSEVPAAAPPYRSGGMDDPALVVAARRGDQRALQALFASCRSFVRARVRAQIGDHRDLEDIVQTALMQAARCLPALREEKFFRTWLARVTLGAVGEALRRQSIQNRVKALLADEVNVSLVTGTSAAPDVVTELRLIRAWLRRRLPRDVSAMLILRRMEGYSIDEIASVMCSSPATVKRKISKGEQMVNRMASSGVGSWKTYARRRAVSARIGEDLP